MSFPRKTKNVLGSIFLTVHVLLTVQCVSESTSISSFFIKSWDTGTTSWVRAVDIFFPREDVRLECTPTEFSQDNELHITRADGFPLSKNHTMDIQKDSQSLVVILKSVECSQMGTYVCQNGRGDKKTVDLSIYHCPPRPCKDQSTDITLYVSVNKATQFSVCVEAFPKLSSLFLFNGIEVRFNRTNELPGVQCTQSKLEEVFSTNNITCAITVTSDKNYTVHIFSIPDGAEKNPIVNFTVRIEKPGPPECPTGISSTNQERDSVTLSWQPVKNRGGSKPVNYTIFYTRSTNDTHWERYNTVEDSQTTITGLKDDTVYEFRVVSANEYSQVINENTCTDTVKRELKPPKTVTFIITPPTTTITTATQTVTEVLEPIVIALIVLAIIVVIAVVVGVIACFKLRKLHTGISRATSLATISYQLNQRALPAPRGEYASVRRTEDNDGGATSSGQGPVRHVSPEGLTYVTIDHSKTRPKRGKRKSEKVTYATLDPINTGKYTVTEIPSDKEYGNIRVT